MDFTNLPQPFRLDEAVAAGHTRAGVYRAQHSGRLTRLAKRLYTDTESWLRLTPWAQRHAWAQAAQRLTKDAIVSHGDAAVLLGLPNPRSPEARICLTLLDDRRTSHPRDWRSFHRGQTPPEHIVVHGDTASFIPERVVLDCIRTLRPADSLAIADAALARGLVTHESLDSMRRHQAGWAGVARADGILALADGRRESWFESASAWEMAAWGLPVGIPQVLVQVDGVIVARADAVWPELGVIGEADGQEKYGLDGDPEAAHRAERTRESRLTSAGWDVVRWVPQDLRDGGALANRFGEARERAAAGRRRGILLCSCCVGQLADCVRGPQWASQAGLAVLRSQEIVADNLKRARRRRLRAAA